MTERRWYPTFLTDDEFLPEGRDSAEAWLPSLLHGDDEIRMQTFKAGDHINFHFVENRGTIKITVNADGTIYREPRCADTLDMFPATLPEPSLDPPSTVPPPNHFSNDEAEAVGVTLEEFADCYADMIASGAEPEVTVYTHYWSGDFLYRISDDAKSLILVTQQATASAQENPSC